MLGNRWRRRRRESGRRQLEHRVRPAGKNISMILRSKSLVTTKQTGWQKRSRWSCVQDLLWRQNSIILNTCRVRAARSASDVELVGREAADSENLVAEGEGEVVGVTTVQNINKHSLVTDWRLVYCESETSNTHLQRIEGGLRLDGDGEATSSTVSVTIRSLWTETLEQKKNTKERKKHFV